MSFLDSPSKAFQGGQKGGSETFEKGKSDKPFSEFLSFTKERYPQAKSVEPPKGSKAVHEFMDSFESELGIPPQKILGAMAKLNPDQLEKPVEETAELVVKNLDLDPKDQDKAMALYMQMLGQWKQQGQLPLVMTPPASAVPSQELGSTVAMASLAGLAGKNALDANLAQAATSPTASQLPQVQNAAALKAQSEFSSLMLQNSSAMTDLSSGMPSHAEEIALDPASTGMPEPLSNPMKNVVSNLADRKIQSYRDLADPSSVDLQKLKEVLGKFDQSAEDLQSKIQGLETPSSKEGTASLSSAMTEQESLQEMKPQLKSLQAPAVEMKNPTAMMQQLMDGPSSAEKVVAVDSAKNAGSEAAFGSATSASLFGKKLAAEKKESEELMDDGSADMYQMTAQSMDRPMKSADVDSINAAFMDTAPLKPGTAPQDPNIQNILRQAQYAINKGGGEARVQMNPEGMGQVNLHVAIHDGKVSLQMEAETPEAKKLIETSINDLKDSLRLHRLSVDQVKIDVIQSTNTDTGTQFSNSSQQGKDSNAFQNSSEFGKNQSRQFWDQFRDDRPGQRTQFFESAALKRYADRPRDPVTSAEHKPKPRSVQGKGTGLNVVA
jgi:flagellar hook-length control protein FliK